MKFRGISFSHFFSSLCLEFLTRLIRDLPMPQRLLLTKSWIGISQRKSGCQESAVDRGWGRSFRPREFDGIWGQLYNWELSCTLAFGGNELMVTRLIGTKSFANTHWSSILKLWKLDYRYEIFFMVIPYNYFRSLPEVENWLKTVFWRRSQVDHNPIDFRPLRYQFLGKIL